MADYTTKAQVILSVNGKQAEQIFKTLEKDAEKLRKKMDEAAKIGDKGSLMKLQRELKKTEKQMDLIKGSAKSVEDVLKSLDKASPKQLRGILAKLRNELNGIERGSEAWNQHVKKIREVKAEIKKVSDSMREQQTLMDRLNGVWSKFQNAVVVAGAAVTGLVLAGRKAVGNYADMEQEMANVRKFTGMTEDDVKTLNEEFKKIDTRTGRDELNRLAQEAGRLGKTSIEDVLGFVKAADKINVALDDLGDGATLTLSKLTGIFGDEARLGTEKALLSVGSVINELSQNSSASAPYLAEFASRMGGVGAQAGMTVPQIMAFGAVLDSNQQAVEASATALSQVMVRIYQQPAKYAKVAGMNIKEFTQLVKTDMNQAMIEFLGHLKSAGSMDVLSPMFREMGENGSRAIAALSTLASKIDDVKQQQINANKAFAEAISLDNEFYVQNNTVQAGMEKAKKSLTEISIQLGEKLMPAMSHVISSSTLAMKALSAIVDFVIKFKSEIITVTAAIVSYNAILMIYTARTKIAEAATIAYNGTISILRRTLPALNLLWAAAANAVQYFTNGLRVSSQMKERWQTAMAGMKLANWTGLVLAAAAAIFLLAKRIRESKSAAEEFAEARRKIEADAAVATKNQISLLDNLYKKTQDQTAAESERIAAVNQLKAIYPEYFKDLSNEAILAGNAADAYARLRDSILESARAKGRESRIADLEKEIQALQNEYDKKAAPIREYVSKVDKMGRRGKVIHGEHYESQKWKLKSIDDKYSQRISELQSEQESLAAKNLAYELSNLKPGDEAESGNAPGGSFTPEASPSNASYAAASDKARFTEEEEWRQEAEALARIFYATGITNYIEYNKSMDEIAVEYNSRRLKREDLSEKERLMIAAEYTDAVKKQEERFTAESIDAENSRHAQSMANLKQYYIDGRISKQTYDQKTEEEEAAHMQTLINLQKEGSDERLRLEDQLNNLLIRQMQRRQDEAQKLEQQYAEIKKTHFGLNETEKKEQYEKDLSLLQVVYEREIQAATNNANEKLRIEEAFEKAKLALKKKYGLLSEQDYKNSLQKGVSDSVQWLNSDGGQAVLKSFETVTSGMSSIFSQLSSLMKTELEIQTAAISEKYDKEIKAAEGNSYKVAQLEKKKQAEIAKAKNEANKKMFAIQVIQAVAQTAQAAINAYSSAAAIPVVGYILAPIAAAMAVAAGAIQIATIKKQQAASAAQGYAEGGFTKEGDKYEPAGIVHAGEWVASQTLTRNPRVRPILEALDQAQKTNSYPVLSPEYVAMRSAAPVMLAHAGLPEMNTRSSKLEETIAKLNRRLDEPLVSVATVAGDRGIARAQESYSRLLKNKKS